MRPEDFVARFGGDEFIILLNRLEDATDAQKAAARINEALAEPFDLSGHQVVTRASIGIVLSTSRFNDAEELIRNADIAMYAAKSDGKAKAGSTTTACMSERTAAGTWRTSCAAPLQGRNCYCTINRRSA